MKPVTKAARTPVALLAAALAVALAVVLGLGVLGLGLLLATSTGARFALDLVGERVPGAMSVAAVDGSLMTGLELEDVRYRDGAFSAELESLSIVPDFTGLIDRRVVLDRFEARNGTLAFSEAETSISGSNPDPEAPSAGADNEPFALPDFPDYLEVQNIMIENVGMEGLGTPIHVESLAGRLEGPHLVVETVELTAAEAALDASLDMQVDGQEASGSLAALLTLPDIGSATSAADEQSTSATSSADPQNGSTASVAEPQTIAVDADFRFAAGAEPGRAVIEWSRLTWQKPGVALSSPSGRVALTLGAEPIVAELSARLEGEPLPDAADVTALASVSGNTVEIERSRLEMLGGTATASGALGLETLSGYLYVDYEGFDPSIVDERLAGVLRGRFAVAATMEPVTRIGAAGNFGGELKGRALDGRVWASYVDQALTIEQAEVRLEDGSVELQGSLSSETTDLTFSARLPELDNWYPPTTGSVTASGTVTGDTDNPKVDVELEGADLAWEAVPIPPLERLFLRVDGTLEDHALSLEASSALGELSLDAEQGYADDRLRGTLLDSVLAQRQAGTWSLVQPADFAADGEDVALQHACYAGPQDGRLCFDISDGTLVVEADALPNALAEPWLPEGVRLEGTADASAEIPLTGPLEGSVTFHQESLSIGMESEGAMDVSSADGAMDAASTEGATNATTSDAMEGAAGRTAGDAGDRGTDTASDGIQDAAGEPEPADGDALASSELTRLLDLTDVSLSATIGPDGLQAQLSGGPDVLDRPIEGRLKLSPLAADGQLEGSVSVRVSDLSVVEAFVDDVENFDGELDVSLEVAGTPQDVQLFGTVRTIDLGAEIPPLGIEITDGRLSAEVDGLENVAFEGELCSNGCMSVQGRLQLPGDAPWALEATVDGDRFEIVDLPDATAVVAPDLKLRVDEELTTITGTLGIPEASLEVEDVPRSAIRPAPETVVYGREESSDPDEGLPIPLVVDVQARLGDVRFEGLGIEAQLDGNLRVQHAAEGRWLVQGTSAIEHGTFSAYGQELVVEHGLLIFTGSPENPGLAIRATRVVEGAEVGVAIAGTARDPSSEIFSDTAMSDSEALARLLTGRSLENAGEADPEALERAAIGLGLRRALPALGRIGESLGLDELGVESAGDEQGAIVAGRQLGEDVYLRYKHGLFDEFSGLELIYRITQRFRLRTETGTAQAIDLIYELEREGADELDEDAEEIEVAIQDQGQSPAEVAAPNLN